MEQIYLIKFYTGCIAVQKWVHLNTSKNKDIFLSKWFLVTLSLSEGQNITKIHKQHLKAPKFMLKTLTWVSVPIKTAEPLKVMMKWNW